MGAHIGFDKGGATFFDDLANGCFQACSVRYVLDECLVMRGLIVDAPHDDQAMIRESDAFGEFDGGRDIRDDRVVKIRFRGCVMSRQFKPGFPIDEQDQLAAECQKRDVRMRAKAAFACNCRGDTRRVVKGGLNLGSCGRRL